MYEYCVIIKLIRNKMVTVHLYIYLLPSLEEREINDDSAEVHTFRVSSDATLGQTLLNI